jgi:hypothetical protein
MRPGHQYSHKTLLLLQNTPDTTSACILAMLSFGLWWYG